MWKNKIKKFIKIIKYKRYAKKCKRVKQNQYILFGTPLHGNLGDHAIAIAEKTLLKDCNIECFEVSTDEEQLCYQYLIEKIPKEAVILITGGGSIGSQWLKEEHFIRKCINDYNEHKIIIFPQTIYYQETKNAKIEKQKDIEVYKKATDLTICTREKKSYELANSMHENAKVILIPDIVLYLENKKNQQSRKGILLCIRKDTESNIEEEERKKIEKIIKKYGYTISYTDTVLDECIKPNIREKKLKDKIVQFSKVQLVITDRLHGMIFARIANTPCIAIGNYNYKVKGVYEWIKEEKNIKYIDYIQELDDKIKEIKRVKKSNRRNLKAEFEILENILKESRKFNGKD